MDEQPKWEYLCVFGEPVLHTNDLDRYGRE